VSDTPAEFYPHNHVFFPHYYSTYCIHDRHGECRKTCKTCSDPCLCPCHRLASTDTGG